MKAQIFHVDGSSVEVEPRNGRDFQLDELYELVECDCIEIVQLHDGRQMVVDDNGIANRKKVNPEATKLYHKGRNPAATNEYWQHLKDLGVPIVIVGANPNHEIFGTALVCNKNQIR